MLSELTIENIAVIEKVQLTFSRGFSCLTGETGAGKSIIIDAINCITGEKTSRDRIRSGENSARVTAVFTDLSDSVRKILQEHDVDDPGEDLIISRRITRDGKNNCRINGMPVSLSLLRVLGEKLVNIHGQMDSKNLLDAARHYMYIDSYGKTDDLLAAYRKIYGELCEIRKEMKRLSVDESEKLKRIDLLDFQIEELTAANLQPGEQARLQQALAISRNEKKITELLALASELLLGTEETAGAASSVRDAGEQIAAASEYFPEFAETAASLEDMSYSLSEIGNAVADKLNGISYSEQKEIEMDERLSEIKRLARKYGETEEQMLSYLEKIRREREEIDSSQERLLELNSLFDEAAQKAKDAAKALSKARREAAKKFADAVCEQLQFLNMPNVQFSVEDTIVPLNENGVDQMSFLFSANPGEPPKPLNRIASGGELSRVMLAIKNVLSSCDDVQTLIFDEIDTGVSGRAAEKIAMKLYELSLGRQVICVTHLTQLAMFADAQYLIQKQSDGATTTTTVTQLSDTQRAYELARMGGGAEIGETQLENAAQLLSYAREYKQNL